MPGEPEVADGGEEGSSLAERGAPSWRSGEPVTVREVG